MDARPCGFALWNGRWKLLPSVVWGNGTETLLLAGSMLAQGLLRKNLGPASAWSLRCLQIVWRAPYRHMCCEPARYWVTWRDVDGGRCRKAPMGLPAFPDRLAVMERLNPGLPHKKSCRARTVNRPARAAPVRRLGGRSLARL